MVWARLDKRGRVGTSGPVPIAKSSFLCFFLFATIFALAKTFARNQVLGASKVCLFLVVVLVSFESVSWLMF